jgi:hypothetical protein
MPSGTCSRRAHRSGEMRTETAKSKGTCKVQVAVVPIAVGEILKKRSVSAQTRPADKRTGHRGCHQDEKARVVPWRYRRARWRREAPAARSYRSRCGRTASVATQSRPSGNSILSRRADGHRGGCGQWYGRGADGSRKRRGEAHGGRAVRTTELRPHRPRRDCYSSRYRSSCSLVHLHTVVPVRFGVYPRCVQKRNGKIGVSTLSPPLSTSLDFKVEQGKMIRNAYENAYAILCPESSRLTT